MTESTFWFYSYFFSWCCRLFIFRIRVLGQYDRHLLLFITLLVTFNDLGMMMIGQMNRNLIVYKITARFPRPLPRGRPRVAPRGGLPRPRLFDFLLGELSESMDFFSGVRFREKIPCLRTKRSCRYSPGPNKTHNVGRLATVTLN
jgi:hypothetical protein